MVVVPMQLLPCGHVFHIYCFIPWLPVGIYGGTCPQCRVEVPLEGRHGMDSMDCIENMEVDGNDIPWDVAILRRRSPIDHEDGSEENDDVVEIHL